MGDNPAFLPLEMLRELNDSFIRNGRAHMTDFRYGVIPRVKKQL